MFVTSTPDQYLYNPAWQVKMSLLALAGLNMVLFYLTASRRLKLLGPMTSRRSWRGCSRACR
jgi:hypothetical protein